jgi:hypothetical protein
MTLLRLHGWRLALVASAVFLVLGGRMHPEADAEDSLREELATMTADDGWVTGHSLIVVSALLLALGLWTAYRQRVWPADVRRPLLIGAVAVSLYLVETVAHLSAAVDSDALAHGHAAPVAWTHVGLSSVLYPLSGVAIAYLAWRMGRAWGGWRRGLTGIGVAAGLLHALSVPLTILFPDAELSPAFAGAAMLIALWSLVTGILGAPQVTAVPQRPREVLV